MPKLRSIVVATALAAAVSLPVAPVAHATHSCALDDFPTLDQICESHLREPSIVQKLVCLVLGSC